MAGPNPHTGYSINPVVRASNERWLIISENKLTDSQFQVEDPERKLHIIAKDIKNSFVTTATKEKGLEIISKLNQNTDNATFQVLTDGKEKNKFNWTPYGSGEEFPLNCFNPGIRTNSTNGYVGYSRNSKEIGTIVCAVVKPGENEYTLETPTESVSKFMVLCE